MLYRSVFQSRVFLGALSSNGKKSNRKRAQASLMLTSLIDAFSILVVYLLMFFSNAGDMAYVSSDIDLPTASSIERLDRHFVIQVKKEGYFVEERKLAPGDLTVYLANLRKKLGASSPASGEKDREETVTIQADKAVRYNRLSPVIQACGQAGFSHIKFAVLSE